MLKYLALEVAAVIWSYDSEFCSRASAIACGELHGAIGCCKTADPVVEAYPAREYPVWQQEA